MTNWINDECRRMRLGWLMLLIMVGVPYGIRAAEFSPTDLSRRIDERLGLANADESQFAHKTAFLRRLTLDLAGRIPTIAEVHDFHDNTSETRREDAIHRLMQSGVYDRNMATFWRRAWVPQADTREFASVADGFELWLAHRLREGTRYNDLVVEILTMDTGQPATGKTTPIGFYEANLSKPENLAASSTRAFLGINLDCAQCHNHPFARWTREQFWETAAFFALPTRDEHQQARLPKVRIPDTELEYEPALLTKAEISFPAKLDSVSLRQVLVDWMKADRERLLAKNAVNRMWAHFFGEALIEPLDDLSRDEFQSDDRADLLKEIAETFIASGYKLDFLVEGIVGSKAYRLAASTAASRVPSEHPAEDKTPFRLHHASIRGLTGEQLYDSLQTAAGLPAERRDLAGGSTRGRRRDFSAQFYVERTHHAERSISQALALMNGALVNELTSAKSNSMLASVLSSPFMTLDEQIDTVYLAVLGRHVRENELPIVKRNFLASPEAKREQHLGNLFWVLVNSAEFNTNH